MQVKAFINSLHKERLENSLHWNVNDRYLARIHRIKLRKKNFSLISNNCLAGSIYHKFGLPYTSPTVGLFFFSEDYLRFLENFRYYIRQPLTLKDTSVHPDVNQLMINLNHHFPVGVLGGDVEIEFLHYNSKDEAYTKWNRRAKRIDYNNLFFIFSDCGAAGAGAGYYDFKEEYLDRFEMLPYSHKVFFSAKPRIGKSVVFVRDYKDEAYVGNMVVNRRYEKYFDVVEWINSASHMQGELHKKAAIPICDGT